MIDKEKQKSLGQVWTPETIIKLILDKIGYTDEKPLTSKILEPSFGSGVFVKEIIKRIYTAGKTTKLSNSELEQLVDSNLYAVEYDELTFQEAKKDIISWAYTNFNLKLALPHVIQQDALLFDQTNFFDFVVGNPPYVRVHNLPLNIRELVKKYSHATGTTDLYVIFYELGLNWLNQNGKLGYIAPNGWVKNTSQKNMRKTLIQERYIKEILDFGNVNVFPGIATYTNITILDKMRNNFLTYSEMETETKEKFKIVKPYENLPKEGQPLIFVDTQNDIFLQKYYFQGQKNVTTINSLVKVQNGLATLSDKTFVLDKTDPIENFIQPVVKGSTYKGGVTENHIVFPYTKHDGKYKGISEEDFKNNSPVTYERFLSKKQLLENRSIDKGSLWFWYGRSQSIQETDKHKLVISPLIHPDSPIKTHIVPPGTLVYSGLFITSKTGDDENLLKYVKEIIEANNFAQYAQLLGKNMNGGYKNISAPIIKNYIINTPIP